MTEATQRPWNRGENGRDTFGIYAANGKRIAEVLPRPADDDFGFPDEAIANADLIVKAGNSHDALVAALDNFLAWIDSPDLEWGGVPETPELVAVRAALEAAK